MKKLLSSLIVLLLLVACCLIAAFPTSATDINYADYDIIDGVILEYVGKTEPNIVIPTEDENGQAITAIDSRAFRYHEEIISVVIPEGIEKIGDECFERSKQISEASLPYSLQEVGYSCFRGTNIMSITIPGQLSVIKHDFVVGPISEVFLSPGIEEIHTGAFYGFISGDLIIPKSVYLVQGAFIGGLSVTVKELNLYILNDDCELGEIQVGHQYYDKEVGSPAPIVKRSPGSQTKIKIYGLKDSLVEEYAKTYMNGANDRFLPLDKDEVEEYEAQAAANGIIKPTDEVDEDPDDEDPDDKGGSKDDKDDKDNKDDNATNGANNGSALDPTLLLIIGGGFLLFIIIIVVVLVLVLTLGNKKKKKKKKKVAKAPEEAVAVEETAPVVEETTEVVEEVTEEQGEEE